VIEKINADYQSTRLANLSEHVANRIANLHIGIFWYNFDMQKRKSRFNIAAIIRKAPCGA
jgi:hypothetical protein